MSSVLITRRLRNPDTAVRGHASRSGGAAPRSAGTARPLVPTARKPKRVAQAQAARFVIALVPRGTVSREKRYLARRNGRTYFVNHARDAMTYTAYKTAHMIGIKAAVHYGCVACIEEL